MSSLDRSTLVDLAASHRLLLWDVEEQEAAFVVAWPEEVLLADMVAGAGTFENAVADFDEGDFGDTGQAFPFVDTRLAVQDHLQ